MNNLFHSRNLVPPPDKMTWQDIYRFGLGFFMIPLGIVILIRAIQFQALSPGAVMVSLVFIAFGIYRIYVGITRYRMYRSRSHELK